MDFVITISMEMEFAMTLTTVWVSTTHVGCVTDPGLYTSVGAQIFQKEIAIVMESNSMLLEFVEEVVRRI